MTEPRLKALSIGGPVKDVNPSPFPRRPRLNARPMRAVRNGAPLHRPCPAPLRLLHAPRDLVQRKVRVMDEKRPKLLLTFPN